LPVTMIKDRDILEAAILGYQAQIGQIEGKIAGIKLQLAGPVPSVVPAKGGGGVPTPFKKPPKPRKKLSAKARKAIGAATKKRWAEGKMKRTL
jgi:hypothetical protein